MTTQTQPAGLAGMEDPGPLRAAHTPNIPALLRRLGASLLVTTYQAGKLVVVRGEGDHLNTHYRTFQSPMGLAPADGGARLAVGTTIQVWEFRDNRDVARRLEPAGTHDACFLPRSSHVTGHVQIHEMGDGDGNQLWFVNTRFSCLATLDAEASFTPRWRPPFVTELEPSDRCHLNGLAMVDGKPKYVTALGDTDTPAGWRANKACGGIANEGTLVVNTSRVLNNRAASAGGGISTTGGTATISGSVNNANRVDATGVALGGGIYSEGSVLSLTDCRVNANQANGKTARGGGIYALDSTVDVRNSTINANQANGSELGEGGGVYNSDSLLTLLECVVNGNSATTGFDDIFVGV